MKRYLREFETQADYNAAKSGSDFYLPCVSLIENTMNCEFDPYVSPVPNDEIWYTSTNGQVVSPYKTESLPTIVSNTYSEGKGIIKFATNVTSIGYMAFANCTSLTSIEIPNSVTTIGDYAFSGCTGLTSPVYNAHVFAYMPRTYSDAYTIPDGIESIAAGAFEDCTGLTSVTIPNSVTSIGYEAFRDCTGMTSVTIGNGVTSIEISAFYGCTGLKSVTIPNSVTSIGDEAFCACSGLTNVTIGNSVTSIKDMAFSFCDNIEDVTFLSTTPVNLENEYYGVVIDIFAIVAGYGPANLKIHVPEGYESTYATHDAGWEVLAPYIVGYNPS